MATGVAYSETIRARAHALRGAGLSLAQISERIGVHKGTLGQWLRGVGEYVDYRECARCGESFRVNNSGSHRFCADEECVRDRRREYDGARRQARKSS